MLIASRAKCARIAFTLLTTWMLVPGFTRNAAASDSHQADTTTFVMKDEITKMQGTLRDKGLYRGKIDGIFGLRTRASIRAYQQAENLPVTGQVDIQTADGLGVRPESGWGNSPSSDIAGGDIKPSANIKWPKSSKQTSKTP